VIQNIAFRRLREEFHGGFIRDCVEKYIPAVAFTVLFGRFFCGYACAFGTLGDTVYALFAPVRRALHIPDDPCFYEKFYFTPGDLGFKPIQTSVGCLGVLVCWDQWYPEAARLMALNGAQLLIYPTAIGGVGTDSKEEQQTQRQAWQLVQRGHSVANGLPVITVNRVGHEEDPSGNTIGLDFWGYSFATGPQGEILAQFGTDEEEVKVVDIDLDRTEYVRRGWPFLRDRRIDAYSPILSRYGK